MFISLLKKLGGFALFVVGLFFLFGTVVIAWTTVANPELDSGTGWGLGGFFAVTSAMFLWVGWGAIQTKSGEQTVVKVSPPSAKRIKRRQYGRSIGRISGAFIFCACLLLVWYSAACAKFVAEYRGDRTTEGAYAVIQLIPWVAIAGWVISFRLMWPKIESEKTFDAKGREQPTNRQGCGCGLSCILVLFVALVMAPQQQSLEPPHVTAEPLAAERERQKQKQIEAQHEAAKETEHKAQQSQFLRENKGKPDAYSVEKLKTLLRDKTMAQVRSLFGPPDDNLVFAGNEIWFYSNGIMNKVTEKVDTLKVEFKKPVFSDSNDDSKVKCFGTPAGRIYKP